MSPATINSLPPPEALLRHWLIPARHTPLGILIDLDGTLIPFAATPREARLPSRVALLLEGIARLPGVRLAVISGRSRESLEECVPALATNVFLVAEHGAWLRGDGAWQPLAEPLTESPVGAFGAMLSPVIDRYPGAFLEPKTWSLTLNLRGVRRRDRMALRVEAMSALAEWASEHPDFMVAESSEAVEIRPARIRKAVASGWMRKKAGTGGRLLVLGDDLSDEDLFATLTPSDEAILVGEHPSRPTRARWRLNAPDDAVAFLGWLGAVRSETPTGPAAHLPFPILPPTSGESSVSTGPSLLVISNRLPELRSPVTPEDPRQRRVGGLVTALEPILKTRAGIWLGWSGQCVETAELGPIGMDESSQPPIAWLDFPRRWVDRYYGGFCNRALWPLLHSFPGNVRFEDDDWQCYGEVNDAFATVAARIVPSSAAIWAHDYHLLLVARSLRRLGHRGPLGHFLHIPFPSPDLLSMLPWAEDLVDAILEFDLIGFQTEGFAENFRQCVGLLSPARISDDAVMHRSRRIRIGAFPIGIIPEDYSETAPADDEVAGLLEALSPTQLILGVDRLDYTKGIPARLQAFGRLLEANSEWRGKVSLVQISVPTRADIPEYAEQRGQVESVVGRINGEFGDGRWVPVRYLYRSFTRPQLAQLYRAADVGLVTPLRDGMNLVAKEFVAAQDPRKPGILVLSKFAGAAAELVDAVQTNPYHVDSLAKDLDFALRQPIEERQARHAGLLRAVSRTTARTWAEDFLGTLLACHYQPEENSAMVSTPVGE